ncbi:MAG TPA: FAD-binding protein, partial [Bdellovibrionales bacterium]|nr:FAD-binding protein [Bdellovibrionales bacterium]
MKDTEVLVLGSGLAGLVLALKLADDHSVLLCTKTDLSAANSAMAQGGIAAVMSAEDSFDRHVQDTLNAGAGLCDPLTVRQVIEQGPARIRDLIDWGVKFDLDTTASSVDLTREAGHSVRRILHIADHTGQDVHAYLLARVLAHPKIQILENHYGLDLILNHHVGVNVAGERRCHGAYVLNRGTGEVFPILSQATFLATGGAGKAYLYTSNWSGATGDGIAMAYRAGARVANMEFMQFHPTCLYHPQARNFLISEALRGEGGELVDAQGFAFMKRYSEMGSLAPRDIVARSIDAEMKRTGAECVFLDMTRAGNRDFLARRFPAIYNRCLELGIDIATRPLPVVPAAHYLCGGVWTDVDGVT